MKNKTMPEPFTCTRIRYPNLMSNCVENLELVNDE